MRQSDQNNGFPLNELFSEKVTFYLNGLVISNIQFLLLTFNTTCRECMMVGRDFEIAFRKLFLAIGS